MGHIGWSGMLDRSHAASNSLMMIQLVAMDRSVNQS